MPHKGRVILARGNIQARSITDVFSLVLDLEWEELSREGENSRDFFHCFNLIQ